MNNKNKEFEVSDGVQMASNDKSIPKDEFSKNMKVRVTMFYDEDLLKAIRIDAAKRGMKYQTLIHQILFEQYLNPGEKSARHADVEELRHRIQGLEKIMHSE